VLLVDSHCHLDRLDLAPFGGELDAALKAAAANDVGYFLCVGIDLEHMPVLLEMAAAHENVFTSVGVHPNHREGEEPTVERLVEIASRPEVIAIGETGLDYFRSEGDLEWQRARFRTHIAAARAVGKPLIIHSREARGDAVDILREEGADEVGGIMHCFVDDWAVAEQALALGFYISLSGIVTFNSARELKEVAKRIPEERLLVETDSPYLAPVPHRGKPNQPAYVRHVAECVAQLRGASLEAIAETTTQNFFRLFPR